ncbi:NTP transferase domain-containing protein [bacterium]|nr:NTP transferase domain-containing protein [bacterium]
MVNNNKEIQKKISEYSDNIDYSKNIVSIILAAGHGKRLKTESQKVLHKVWGIPSIKRIAESAKQGLACKNQIIVVGHKAIEVIDTIGKIKNTVFVYQNEQKGTGHAVKIALDALKNKFEGSVFIFPGDMCLMDSDTIRRFAKYFEFLNSDMMLATGIYTGPPELNYYGRILRVPDDSQNYRIIDLIEYKDILKLTNSQKHEIEYKNRKYSFSKEKLLQNSEFNSGMYAFRINELIKHINKIGTANVKKERYLTDMVKIYNRSGLSVDGFKIENKDLIIAFNNKTVLKYMESILRKKYYEQLKNLITIQDEEKFFIHEQVIKDIIKQDKKYGPLDISIGEDAYISSGVKLNRGVVIGKHTVIDGNIVLGENSWIDKNVYISTYSDQTLKIGENSRILQGDIIKGNTAIGKNVRIESSVNITGSDEFPTRINDNCLIKGTSYIFGSIIEKDNWIEHSVLIKQRVCRTIRKDGSIQKVKYILPLPQGIDSLESLDKD